MLKPVRVLIVDDHPIVRRGLRTLIDQNPDLEVAGEAADGEQAIHAARALVPDVILLDLVMPRKDGIAAIHEILHENPDARILVLTSFSDDERVFAAIKAGALGYLLKDCLPTELIDAMRAVYRGEPSLSPAVGLKLVRELRRPASLPPTDEPLSEREAEVLEMTAQGLSHAEIAAKLGIGNDEVVAHVSNILSKLGASTRAHAVALAVQHKLVT
jgi:NarL family two-component system response regulator LiaR